MANRLARIVKLEESAVVVARAAVVSYTDVDVGDEKSYTSGNFTVNGESFTYKELQEHFEYMVFMPEKDSTK